MLSTVERLQGFGPREATGPAFRRAAAYVQERLETDGWQVARQGLSVPAGQSWGVPVDAGETFNLVATRDGLDPEQPHVVVGAHLDTVPQSPGAEDNASGVAVLLELARLAAAVAPQVPVMFVVYGAEEPRGPGDSRHHYGSRVQVARMSGAERDAVQAMLALDRVGVGSVVPVCDGGLAGGVVARQLLAAAERAGVPTTSCGQNRSSDHWSFEKAGIPAGRLGSTSWAGYHSAADTTRYVRAAQLGRSARIAWEWLSGLR
ncbi:M28 family metallopeptidase [Motilibacter aurantiacus]|uniref:M28 family metallopeptidase n=1 Tax=Motilibacter aurantiacus TaxID=2714955 RepID=UPI001408F11E|nr:M28 family peptidase [Motilibacter aurantiacus]NHC43987.1 M28 family peptidase [Motilibacter aurantiacus]